MKASKVILEHFNNIGFKPTILDALANGNLLIEAISIDGSSYNYQTECKITDNRVYEQYKTLTWST